MKRLLANKSGLLITGIVFLTAWLYRNSFTARFFQDDALLLQKSGSAYWLTPVPDFHYHLISNQLFYFLSQQFFGLNPTGYHVIEFIFFIGTLIILFNLAKMLIGNESKAFMTVFFYALNISIFANFYWIAVSYFVFGGFFAFLTILLYLQKGKLMPYLALLSFVLGLLSNELLFILPMALILVAWYQRSFSRRLAAIMVTDFIFIIGKIFYIGFPHTSEYNLQVGLSALGTFRWYFLRALNLPEGVQRISSPIIFILFGLLTVILAVSLIKYLWSKPRNMRLFLFGGIFFVLFALPFFFLPNHMSSYYLTISLFGPALVVGEIIRGRKLTVLFCFCYVLLTLVGLEFLSQTHWIILKNTGPIGKF